MSKFHHGNVICLGVLLFALSVGASVAAVADVCDTSRFSDVNSTLRLRSGEASVSQCFMTELPSAGWLLLEATVPSSATTEPRLEFLGQFCDPQNGGGQPFRYLARTAGGLVIEVKEAGNHHFCVVAQDPAQVLGDYRLVNGFVASSFTKDDENEHEPEPDPLAGPTCYTSRSNGFAKDDENEHEPEPDPLSGEPSCRAMGWSGFSKDDENEHEPEPDPFSGDMCRGPLTKVLREICSLNRTDDVADVPTCATAVELGDEARAELGNDWWDDDDWFSFQVRELTTVAIESNGATYVAGSLYDRNGYRLMTDDGGLEGNFRIVRTLSPGRYFVRVEGSGAAEGAYGIGFERLDTLE